MGNSKATEALATLDQALAESLEATLGQVRRYCVAYSGGLDSHLLLHRCAAWAHTRQVALCALHVDHALQADSECWRVHCQQQADALQIPLAHRRVAVDRQHPEGTEAAAREARYRALVQMSADGEAILLAQHLDDQTETLLLQLFRGAGLAGLSAMPERRQRCQRLWLRPWLSQPQAFLRDAAEDLALQWIDDPSNCDPRFARNFLRREVLPQLRARWPALDVAVDRSRRHIAEAQKSLDEAAREWLAKARLAVDQLDLAVLCDWPEERVQEVVRLWLRGLQVSMPSQAQLQRLHRELLPCRPDAQAEICWRDGALRVYRQRLYWVPAERWLSAGVYPWADVRQPLLLPDGRRLHFEDFAPQALRAPTVQRVSVRFRVGGERLQPAGRRGHKSLKQLYQEIDLAPWRRASVPLLYYDERLVAVAGVAVAEGHQC